MDGAADLTGITTPTTFGPGISSSEPQLSSRPPHIGEHDDSPMRKRPRLASSQSHTTDMSSHDADGDSSSSSSKTLSDRCSLSPAPPGSPAAPSPSKLSNRITLNLRHPAPGTSPTDSVLDPVHMLDADPAASPAHLKTARLQHPTTFIDATRGPPIEPRHSPPVVDIALDGDEADDDDGYIQILRPPQRADDLVQSFPGAADFGPEDAVKAISAVFEDGNPCLEFKHLTAISDWLSEWLTFTGSLETQWERIYTDNRGFWAQVILLFHRIVTKKYNIMGLKSLKTPKEIPVYQILCNYTVLCGQYISIDAHNFANYVEGSPNAPELHSVRLLKTLPTLLCPDPDLSSFWTLLRTRYTLDTSKIITHLVNHLFGHSSRLLESITNLTLSVSKKFSSLSQWQSTLLPCLQILRASVLLRRHYGPTLDATKLLRQILDVAGAVKGDVLSTVEKHNSSLSINIYRELVDVLTDLHSAPAYEDPTVGQTTFDDLNIELKSMTNHDCFNILRYSTLFKFYWHFITKGRMELRVLGVQDLQQSLVDVWQAHQQTQSEIEGTSQHVVNYAADFLQTSSAINYLISVDSHPQLVSRSHNVLSFAMITSRWTQDMTDAVFNTITCSQDSRMVATIWELLCGCVGYADASVLDGFRQKIEALPREAFSDIVQHFLRQLFDHFLSKHQTISEPQLLSAYRLCVRLIQEDGVDVAQSGVKSTQMAPLMSGLLQNLDKTFMSSSARRGIYADCVCAVAEGSPFATGSINVIRTLFKHNKTEDSDHLCKIEKLPEVICENLYFLIDTERFRVNSVSVQNGFSVRLQMLNELSLVEPGQPLRLRMDTKLWTYLVGSQAYDNTCRDLAWNWLILRCQRTERPCPFMSRCVERHLQHIQSGLYAAHMYTSGMVQFTLESTLFQLRTRPDDGPLDAVLATLPLGDSLWDVILSAPDDSVAKAALKSLSFLHTDPKVLTHLNQAVIARNHNLLVERALLFIQDTAAALNAADSENAPSQKDARRAKGGSIVRVLNFLRTFLNDSAGTIQLRIPLEPQKSPSPDVVRPPSRLEERMTLKYQQFAANQQSEVQLLDLSPSATRGDLFQKLQRVTRFAELSTFSAGHHVDLLHMPNLSAADFVRGGLLLVKKIGNRTIESSDMKANDYTTVVETAVMRHHEELFELLTLDDELSHEVFEFLQLFPPVRRVLDSLFSDVTSEDLFPDTRPFKTLYTLQSLIRICEQAHGKDSLERRAVEMATSRLVAAFVDPDNVALNIDMQGEDYSVTCAFCEAFLAVLRLFDGVILRKTLHYREQALTERLYALLGHLRSEPNFVSEYRLRLECSIYELLSTLSIRNQECCDAFRKHEDCSPAHRWLLLQTGDWRVRDQVRSSIERYIQIDARATEQQYEYTLMFYWQIATEMIAESAEFAQNSREFFTLTCTLMHAIDSIPRVDSSALERLPEWIKLLVGSRTAERVSAGIRDEFTHGLAQFVCLCLSSTKGQGFPVDCLNTLQGLLNNLLFPRLTAEMAEEHPQWEVTCPVLDSDTRKVLYRMLLIFCRDMTSLEVIVGRIGSLAQHPSPDAQLLWDSDRSSLLRSPAGFQGLRNLTNTCYMNSLMAQLFLSTAFRRSILEARITDEQGQQKLLVATKKLFGQMQGSQRKFAETWDFASAIVPYDSPQIDIKEQMDVDEFYNLLFDRLESQMLTEQEKTAFRSIYGGDMITQIKSLDCEHVSERIEPYLAISCEVKGKTSLNEGLSAYVQGDAMEGDNKYKCESCGGRFVNAVKRSCLKTIPDNIVFHLKRFDFDLVNFTRSKINDSFEFPTEIDMSSYHYDRINRPLDQGVPDIFELVGILVHVGTTETGHYYSFIRTGTSNDHRWNEFNDTEVNEFDPNKIADQCFGGWDRQWGNMKPYNAYMLFYQRQNAAAKPDIDSVEGKADVPISQDVVPTMSSRVPAAIARENEVLSRQYCCLDPVHAHFLCDLLAKCKALGGDPCSDNHHIEDAMIMTMLGYVHQVASRAKDQSIFDVILEALTPSFVACTRCAALAMQWTTTNPSLLAELILYCPSSKTRTNTLDLVSVAAKTTVASVPPFFDGLVSRESMKTYSDLRKHQGDLLSGLVRVLMLEMPEIAKFATRWAEYFSLFLCIARLGVDAIAVLLSEEVFEHCVELVYLTDPQISPPPHSRFVEVSFNFIRRSKRQASFIEVIRLVAEVLRHINVFNNAYKSGTARLENYDEQSRRFGITREESNAILFCDESQYPFLTKVIDGWEKETTPWAPGEIVAQMLETAPNDSEGEDHVNTIVKTIATAMNEYFACSVEVPLKTAVSFFKHCSRATRARHLLETARHNASQLSDAGADAYLEFFETIAALERVKCSTRLEPEPFLPFVIESLEFWLPGLLLFDWPMIRVRVLQLLDNLIFDHYPSDISEGHPSQLDVIRCNAVLDLFEQAHRLMMAPAQRNCTEADLRELLLLLMKCNEWAMRMQRDSMDSSGHAELYRSHERIYVTIISQSQKATAMFQELERVDEGSEATDTEEASDVVVEVEMNTESSDSRFSRLSESPER